MPLNKTPRRWYRFGLRSLLATVTVACLAGGWARHQLNWIEQRHQALKGISYVAGPPGPAPIALRIFGEPGCVALILFDDQLKSEAALLQRLFPEAEVSFLDHPSTEPSQIYDPVPLLLLPSGSSFIQQQR